MENLLDTSTTITILCKIVAIQYNQYTDIVVEDLNRDYTDDLKYVTVVLLPNWNIQLEIGDVGYMQFQYVQAGKSQWYNKEIEDFEIYKYDNNYIINFFKQRDICKQETFEFK